MEKSNTKRRSADATLLKVLEDGQFEDDELKDNQYPEVFDKQPHNIQVHQSHPTFSQTSTTSSTAMPPGQPYIPRDNYGDFDTRSHKRSHVLDSVPRPSHIEVNFQYSSGQHGTGLRQPPSSATQHQGACFIDKPSGQPFRPTLTPVQQESGSDHSNVHDHQGTTAFNFQSNSPLHSVTVPLKFEKLNEDIREADSTHEVIVFGSDRVGKSTIIHYFVGYHYNLNRALDQQFKTEGVTAVYRNKELKKTIRLNFLEVDKHDISEAKIKRYEQCEVAVVVFDASNNVSLREANYWIDEAYKFVKGRQIEFVLVGNKSDMRNNDKIITKGLEFANRKKMSFHVTCATNGSCMDALLENVATVACNQKSNSIESRFAHFERTLQRFEEKERVHEENQRILRQELEESKQEIHRLQARRCIIL